LRLIFFGRSLGVRHGEERMDFSVIGRHAARRY
jgi:hypothetical protein